MPGVATCAPVELVETAKGKLREHSCSVEHHSWLENVRDIFPTSFAIAWFELPAGLDEREAVAILNAHDVQSGERVIHKGHGAEVNTFKERPITLGGEPGVEFKARLLQWGPQIYFLHQTCAHRRRVYQLLLFGTVDEVTWREWNRMRDSLRFTS